MTAARAQTNLDSFVESAHLVCAAKLQGVNFFHIASTKSVRQWCCRKRGTQATRARQGEACESDSRVAARPLSARMRTIAFVESVSSMIVLGFHSSDSRTHDVHAVVTVMCFFCVVSGTCDYTSTHFKGCIACKHRGMDYWFAFMILIALIVTIDGLGPPVFRALRRT